MLGVPKGPSGIAVIVCPAQGPAAAGAGRATGPRHAGGVQLLPENLYRGIHRDHGSHRQERDWEEAAGERMLEKGKRGNETEVLSQPLDSKSYKICTC